MSVYTFLVVLPTACGHAHQLGVNHSPQELLEMKLNDSEELSATESISLIEHCVQLGDQPAARAIDKVTCLVMGITGSGKSTAINALLGCRMKRIQPSNSEIT